MKIGTKSVLYGAHCAIIHPWFVALAWWKLYGFPFDPRLWIAFFVHDLGYIGKPNMDGKEGEAHPYWGACLMGFLFGKKWFDFTLYHSRFLAKRNNAQYSKLCVADKYAFILTPRWLYLPMVNWTGEIYEYMKHANRGRYKGMAIAECQKDWHESVKNHLFIWVLNYREIKPDTCTFIDRAPYGSRDVTVVAVLKKVTVILLMSLTFTACTKETVQPPKHQHCAPADSVNQAFHHRIIMSE